MSRYAFKVGDRVRYFARECVLGYETSIEADGCVPGVVVGFTKERVRVRLTVTLAGVKSQRVRPVAAENLTLERAEAIDQIVQPAVSAVNR